MIELQHWVSQHCGKPLTQASSSTSRRERNLSFVTDFAPLKTKDTANLGLVIAKKPVREDLRQHIGSAQVKKPVQEKSKNVFSTREMR